MSESKRTIGSNLKQPPSAAGIDARMRENGFVPRPTVSCEPPNCLRIGTASRAGMAFVGELFTRLPE